MTDQKTAGDVEIDTSLFEGLEEHVPCAYTDCETEATHMLVCGVCYTGRETMCGQHTEMTAEIKREAPEIPVVFDQTCGHRPEYGNCPIEPLSL